MDCAALDARSYADVDTVVNPGRISSAQRLASVFIEGQLPSFGGQGTYPVYGLDAGAAADRTFIIDPVPTRFQGARQIDKLLNKTKTLGTHVYRKWLQNPVIRHAISNSKAIPAGATKVTITLYPPFSGPFIVIAQASWLTTITARRISNRSFELVFAIPPSEVGNVDWLAAPSTIAGFGAIPISVDAESVNIAIPPSLAGGVIIPMANFESVISEEPTVAPPPPPPSSVFDPPGSMIYDTYVGPNEGQRPTRINISPSGDVVYVNTFMANFIDTVVVAIDRVTGAVIAESPHYGDGVTLDYHPMSLNVSADGTKVYATYWREGGVNGRLKVLDATTLAELNDIDLTQDIFDVDISKNGATMAIMGLVDIILVDLATLTLTTPWVSTDWALAWPQTDSNHLITWHGVTKQFYYYDLTGTLLATYDPGLVGGIIECVRVHPHKNYIYGIHRVSGNNHLFCYDPATDTMLNYSLTTGGPYVWAFDDTNTIAPFDGFIQGNGKVWEIDDAQNLSSVAFGPAYIGYDAIVIDSSRGIAYTTAQTPSGSNPYALVVESVALPSVPSAPGPDAWSPPADWYYNDYVGSNDGDLPSRIALSKDGNAIFVSTYLTRFPYMGRACIRSNQSCTFGGYRWRCHAQPLWLVPFARWLLLACDSLYEPRYQYGDPDPERR
jgi:hypothetical protein